MVFLFWVISILNLAYILMRKRRFDLFTIAIIAFLYYSYPAFFGYLYIEDTIKLTKIVDQVYYFLITVQVIFFMFVLLYDNKIKLDSGNKKKDLSRYWVYCFLFVSIVLIILDFSISGIDNYLNLNKTSINSSVFYGLAIWGFILTLFLGLKFNLKKVVVISLLFIVFSLFVGSRAYFATAILGVILIKFNAEVRIIKNWRYLCVGLASFLFLVFYKAIYRAVKTLDPNVILETIRSTSFNELSFFAEANSVLSNLNYTILFNYTQIDRSPLFYIVQQLPFSDFFLNESYVRFSTIVSTVVHPNIHFGMASNIWAEFYSIFGYVGMYLLSFLWVSLIFVANYLFQHNKYAFLLLPVIIYSTFYIHRIDFSFAIGAFKSCIFVIVLSYLLYYIYLKPFVKSSLKLSTNL